MQSEQQFHGENKILGEVASHLGVNNNEDIEFKAR